MNEIKKIHIGKADKKTIVIFYTIAIPILFLLSIWIFQSISPSNWKFIKFLLIYILAALFYVNIGVWIHEQLHCLGFRGTPNETNTSITYERKFVLLLTGYYSVEGVIKYDVLQRALLMPLWLVVGFVLLGLLGVFILPAWWLPAMLTLALVSLFDMIHDVYMVSQMRKIGKKGVYKDHGHYLEVILKE
jgi:hypothetical protein